MTPEKFSEMADSVIGYAFVTVVLIMVVITLARVVWGFVRGDEE